MKRNGFDLYLEYLYQQTGSFYTTLFTAIQLADSENLEKLSKGFPEEVIAFRTYRDQPIKYFTYQCTQSHHLLPRFKFENNIE